MLRKNVIGFNILSRLNWADVYYDANFYYLYYYN